MNPMNEQSADTPADVADVANAADEADEADVTEEDSMPIRSKDFRVRPGDKVDLEKWPTSVKPVYGSKKQYQKLLRAHVEALDSLQRLHYASDRYALLLILQGMDAAGKDGAIRHVMSGVNPQGCEVYSFKQPTPEELEHDFLWRTTCRLPERGRDRDLQPFLLQGGTGRSRASGAAPRSRTA